MGSRLYSTLTAANTEVLDYVHPRLANVGNGMMNEQMGSNMIVNVCDPFSILNSHRSIAQKDDES